MRLRLLRDWNGSRAGFVIQPQRSVARLLLKRGIAEIVRGRPPKAKNKKRKDDDAGHFRNAE